MGKSPSTKYRKKRAAYDALVKLSKHIAGRFDLPMPIGLVPAADGSGPKSDPLLSPAKAAEQLGISRKTLANWRSSGTSGLKHVQVGSRIFYRQSDIHEYVSRNAKSSTSEKRGRAW